MYLFAALPQKQIELAWCSFDAALPQNIYTHYHKDIFFSDHDKTTNLSLPTSFHTTGRWKLAGLSLFIAWKAFKYREANSKTQKWITFPANHTYIYGVRKFRTLAAAQGHQPAPRLQNQEPPCACRGWAVAAAKRIRQHQPGADQRLPHKRHHLDSQGRFSAPPSQLRKP